MKMFIPVSVGLSASFLSVCHGFVPAPLKVPPSLGGARLSAPRATSTRLAQQMTEAEAAADAALVERLEAEVMETIGVPLEQLMNPAKVVNLERDLAKLRLELESGINRSEVLDKIEEKEAVLAVEKRTYMRSWLKKLFVGQAILSTFVAGLMAYDAVPLVEHLDLSIRVLGFWCIWLFTVPSLRARKPSNPAEKAALNYAFLATALTNLLAPFATKDPVAIYWANIGVLALCYAAGFATGGGDAGVGPDANSPAWLKFIFKALDFGSGQERGARK